MIIEMLLNVVYTIFEILTTPINIPSLPDNVYSALNSFIEYLTMGVGILSTYTHYSYILILLGISVGIEVAIHLYKLIMFVLRKIPFININ